MNVRNLLQWIGRRFKERKTGPVVNRGTPLRQIRQIDDTNIDAEFCEVVLKGRQRCAKYISRTNHIFSGPEFRVGNGGDRRHP
ncbi:hypothetical protein CBM2626_A130198 [Cupriavidus taiwanensis]|nr:hypothetical protein CBM2626_A130198 [Cupriavidus taiwanensis]